MNTRKQFFLLWLITLFCFIAAPAVNASAKNFTCSKLRDGFKKAVDDVGGQCVIYVRNETDIESDACNGSAYTCAESAKAYGYTVDSVAKLNSIMVFGKWPGSPIHGHIAIVVGIDPKNSNKVTVRDSNWGYQGPESWVLDEKIQEHQIDTSKSTFTSIDYIYCEEELTLTKFEINSASSCVPQKGEKNLTVQFGVKNESPDPLTINNMQIAVHKVSDGTWAYGCWESGRKTIAAGGELSNQGNETCRVDTPGKYIVKGKLETSPNVWSDLASKEFTVSECKNVVPIIAPVLLPTNIFSVNGIVSGKITFVDNNNHIISIPGDVGVRLTPKRFQNNVNNWHSIACKVDTQGIFGAKNCYADVNSNIEGLKQAFNDSTEKFQIAVFKEHIIDDGFHWNCKEDVYKYVGDEEINKSWKAITVSPNDYQDHSNEVCN